MLIFAAPGFLAKPASAQAFSALMAEACLTPMVAGEVPEFAGFPTAPHEGTLRNLQPDATINAHLTLDLVWNLNSGVNDGVITCFVTHVPGTGGLHLYPDPDAFEAVIDSYGFDEVEACAREIYGAIFRRYYRIADNGDRLVRLSWDALNGQLHNVTAVALPRADTDCTQTEDLS